MLSARSIDRRRRLAWLLAFTLLVVAGCRQAPPAKPATGQDEAAADEPAAASPSARDAAPATGLVPGKGDRILTITSDDPQVSITGVLLDGKPMKTAGLGKTSVRALLAADPDESEGTPCDSDGMELRLSNHVIYRPQVDFCATHDLIRAAARLSRPPAPLPAPPVGFAWQSNGRGGDKMIYFGLPETTETTFLATCHQGTTRARLMIFADAGPRPRIDVYAPDRVLRYDLKRTTGGEEEQAPTNQVELSIADPLFAILQQGKPVAWRLGEGEPRTIETASGAAEIAGFIHWCEGAA